MRRLLLYDRGGNPLGELAEADVFEATLREEINGEHSLEITTTQVLEKGSRLLYKDAKNKWREFSVAGIDAEHASGNRAIGTYYCVWSVQEDLQGVTVSVMPGVQSPVTAGAALTSLLSSTSRWAKGTVTNTVTGGASMYDRSAWEALSTLIEVWGGEIDVSITVDTNTGVTSRLIDLYSKQGNQTVKRRFDFGHDLQSVKRTYTDEPLYCRISPRGAGEETDAGGHGRKITIESVNSGRDYLEYSPMVSIARLPDGSGGYEYPTLIIENSNCKTPTELKTWAQSVLEESCTPKVSYSIDVIQAGIEGVDFNGISLGDAVQVVDQMFSSEGIRIEGRVLSITTDLLNERDIELEIGYALSSISSKFEGVAKSISGIDNYITTTSTAEYIDELVGRINTEINSTGGYTYIVQGHGIRTYDVEVSDPLTGSEASKVVEIKGGTIRIANSKTAQGEWEWKTVFTSGHISADLVTAANITTGYIGNSSSGSYWDLDNNLFRIGTGAEIAGTNAGTLVSDVEDAKKVATNYLTYDSSNGLDVGYSGTSAKTRISGSGVEIFDSGGVSALSAQVSNNASTVRVGRDSGSGKVVLSSQGYVDLDYGNVNLAHFGYGAGVNESGGTSDAPYYTLGERNSGSTVGNYSTVIGRFMTASGYDSCAIGFNGVASGANAIALGFGCKAVGGSGVAIGTYSEANGLSSCAMGQGCIAGYQDQVALGQYNDNSENNIFEIGNGGSSSYRKTAFAVRKDSKIKTLLPIPIDSGGSGYAETAKSTSADYITPTEHCRIDNVHWARWGLVTTIDIQIANRQLITVPASGDIGNIYVLNFSAGVGLRPAYSAVALIPELGGIATISTTGAVSLTCFNARGASYDIDPYTSFYIRATYITTLADCTDLQ